MDIIEDELDNTDVSGDSIICIKGNFHQGILGILASRILGDYHKSALVFAKTESGTYKASGRGVDGVDLHALVLRHGDKCLHFGGHKLAVGLEIDEKLVDGFIGDIKADLAEKLAKDCSGLAPATDDADITIGFEDVNQQFLSELSLIGPFGFSNPKPTFKIITSDQLKISQLGAKNSAHIKINNAFNSNVVYFFGKQNIEMLTSKATKELFVDLDFNYYKGKSQPQAIVRRVKLLQPRINISDQNNLILRTYLFCANILNKNGDVQEIKTSLKDAVEDWSKQNGVAIIATTQEAQVALETCNTNGYVLSSIIPSDKSNVIVLSPRYLFDFKQLKKKYQKVLVLDELSKEEIGCFGEKNNVFCYKTSNFVPDIDISRARGNCANVYTAIAKQMTDGEYMSFCDLVCGLNKMFPFISMPDITVSLMALNELGVINLEIGGAVRVSVNLNSEKKDLFESKILSQLR